MIREELKTHCIKQIENCEMWAKFHEEEPHGKVYEEHKLILELLEQESALDKLDEIITKRIDISNNQVECQTLRWVLDVMNVIQIESEE